MIAYCSICGHPLDERGRCSECLANNKAARERMIFFLGSARAADEFTLERFIPRIPADEKALEAAKTFNSTRNYYFHGPPGCGKSHIAAIALRQAIKRGTATKTIIPTDMIRDAWSTYSQAEKSKLIAGVATYPILCIDDLGTGKLTEDGVAVIAELIHKRWIANIGGLIITSNLDLDELAKFFGDDRITSRIFHLCQIIGWPKDAPDHRMERA